MSRNSQLADQDIVSKLLDLSSELLIKGDAGAAFTCTQAAARILAIPQVADRIQHPTKGISYDWNQILQDMDSTGSDNA